MGLLGKADPTLVQGAGIYAEANIPGDKKMDGFCARSTNRMG